MILSGQRGWPVYWDDESHHWKYVDNNLPMTLDRNCYHCGEFPTPEGYDYCIGKVPDAIAACCGHGMDEGYILYEPHTETCWDGTECDHVERLYPIT